jgi:tetratricopeptide (TPR) repeat protein
MILTLFAAGLARAQVTLVIPDGSRLDRGIKLYGRGQWENALTVLRQCKEETQDYRLRAEAQFWIGMSELALGRFDRAYNDLDEVAYIDPKGSRLTELGYHKGRALFYLAHYNEALALFAGYAAKLNEKNEVDYNRKASALFWSAECFYALGDYDRAEEIYLVLTETYRYAHKYEAASYRLEMVKQKRIEAGLLDIIKLREAAKTAVVQESYDNAVSEYVDDVGGLVKKDETKERVSPDEERLSRLLQMKAAALEMLDRLISISNNAEFAEQGF